MIKQLKTQLIILNIKGLIVWYHGALPVDYIGLVATVSKHKQRRMYTVVDRCLAMMPGLNMFRKYLRVGSFSKVRIAGLLEEGELVGVAPGGARECLFDHDLSVMWNERVGFAKVGGLDRKSTRLNSSHSQQSRMPSSA